MNTSHIQFLMGLLEHPQLHIPASVAKVYVEVCDELKTLKEKFEHESHPGIEHKEPSNETS